MNKHGDQFLEMFRDSFGDFAPEVPASVYTGVRKKMFWSNFMGFNFAQLNIWYVLLASSSVALLAWSNLEQNSTGVLATGSEYELTEFREPLLVSAVEVPVEEIINTSVQFSPRRTSSNNSMAQAAATKPSSNGQCEGVSSGIASVGESTMPQGETNGMNENHQAASESIMSENVIEEVQLVEENASSNLPVNMEGSVIEDSNLVDQLKKKGGPIELNMHVNKSATKEQ